MSHRLVLGDEVAVVVPARVAAVLGPLVREALIRARDAGERLDPLVLEVVRELIDQGAAWRAMSASRSATSSEDGHGRTLEPMTAGDVSEILGVSSRHVRRLAASGRLPGQRDAGKWWFDRTTLELLGGQTG